MNKFRLKSLFSIPFVLARRVIYPAFGLIDRIIQRKTNLISILAYHSIAADNWKFSIDLNTMKKQIAYLKKNYQFISLADVEKIIKGDKVITQPSIVLTFDDGYKDVLQIKSYLRKLNIKPALFLINDTRNVNTAEIGKNKTYLNTREIKGLIADGWEIGCHSNTHANLSKLTPTHLQQEIVIAKKSIEKSLGIKVNYFAYPRGKYSNQVLNFIKKANYKMALTMDDGFINKNTNPLLIPRIGVDRSHTFPEFKSAFSPSNILARRFIKNTFIGRYI